MNGWLSPEGKFFPCPIGEHRNKAKEIIENYPDTWYQQVWIHVTMDALFSDLPPTEEQIRWINNTGKRFYKQDLERILDNSSPIITENIE